MVLRARRVSDSPESYFQQNSDEGPLLRVADIMLRYHRTYTHPFTDFIRLGTHSKWSHSSLIYLEPDPAQTDYRICLVDVTTKKGAFIESWSHEMAAPDKFSDGIKRPRMDWYAETPDEQAGHTAHDPENVRGIAYLQQVRDVALQQLHTKYDHKTVWELTALYIERLAHERLKVVPQIANAVAAVENLLERWDEADSSEQELHFICSGLVQYSFFEALRQRILHDLEIPQNREAALSNLNNMQHVVFCDDPGNDIACYIHEVQTGKRDLADAVPGNVLNVLRTATPADFNNSPKLQWRYIINKGRVWQIYEATEAQKAGPESKDEQEILALMKLDTGPLAR